MKSDTPQLDLASPVERLLEVMAMLRHKKYGCAWDLQQSIKSLTSYTLEEAYEVVDAIDCDDMVQLEDELGDLLFQVVFYAQMASEEGHFNFNDVVRAISNKLIRRHPHVFPQGKISNFGIESLLDADAVVVSWEQIKAEERAEKLDRGGSKGLDAGVSALSDVPLALPALERAKKIQKRAANVGFDWQDIAPVLDKLKEEIAELEHAIAQGEQQEILAELGDVLFSVVNVSRHLKAEPENALRLATIKFEKRFKFIESALDKQAKSFAQVDLETMEKLWDKAKHNGL